MREVCPKIYGLEEQKKLWNPCGQAHSKKKLRRKGLDYICPVSIGWFGWDEGRVS